jgi:uncharacterized protein (DUF4415 family)
VEAALERWEVVEDFLPPPEEFRRMRKERITILLDKEIVGFFKENAKKCDTKYQSLINDVLCKYVQKHKEKCAK